MKHYFRIGEISKLYQIGPDSLRYYEELGILSPKRSANGYRQYSIHDLWILNVIRDLRKLEFPMERIKEYLMERTVDSTERLLAEELHAIEKDLAELIKLKEEVITRLTTLQRARSLPIGICETKLLSSRHCHKIQKAYAMDEEMDMLIKQLLNKDKKNLYIIGNNRIGSTVPMEHVYAEKFCDYDSVFVIDEYGPDSLPGGTYVTISYHGNCEQNTHFIPKLLSYAKEQNLIPVGPVLELLWIDIHQAADTSEHITELQIRCH